MKINEFFASLMAAYEGKDYAEALRISREAREHCPEDDVQTLFWQACMHSLMGNAAEAFAALRTGLSGGVWWSPRQLDRESDFDAIRGAREFAEIRAECRKRFDEKQAKAEPGFMTVEPEGGMDRDRCIVVLHWMGGTAQEFAGYWGGWPRSAAGRRPSSNPPR